MKYFKVKELRLDDKLEDWIDECLESYDSEDLLGCYILDTKVFEDGGGDYIVKNRVKGETITLQLGQYLNRRFYKDEIEGILDEKGDIWVREEDCF